LARRAGRVPGSGAHGTVWLSAGSDRLLRAQDLGELYAYEIVNFVDGKRSVGEIRDAVAAEFGPIPLDIVADYLKACEEAKIVALH
jgi:hypothetical protein